MRRVGWPCRAGRCTSRRIALGQQLQSAIEIQDVLVFIAKADTVIVNGRGR